LAGFFPIASETPSGRADTTAQRALINMAVPEQTERTSSRGAAMETQSTYRLQRLDAGEMFSLDAAPGHSVVVFDGQVWITQEGDSADHVIGAGESLECDRPAQTVIEALVPTRLAVLADKPVTADTIGYEAAWPNTGPALFAGSMARSASKDAQVSYA
jgi:hypothetical protein